MKNTVFRDKVVVVTGAASGIGREISKRLVGSGARVVLLDKDTERLEQVCKELGPSALGKVIDVRDFEALREIIDTVQEQFGRIDYLFNNAGIIVGGEVRDVPIDDWRSVIETDLMGVVNGVMAVYPIMVKQNAGHIVNISSLAGLIPSVMEVSYSAAKSGVVTLSHALRAEGVALGVKVSVVCPGCVDTPIWKNSRFLGSTLTIPTEFLAFFNNPLRLLPVEIAVDRILTGVVKNKATIYTDTSSRLLVLLYKTLPGVWLMLSDRYIMKKVRTVRLG